ncbi:hypothetical protein GCM10010344_17810 [Streptomyces bluensis]|nr:hypothetical protein GCM10010344_17810 [Streptomyces bluensis]
MKYSLARCSRTSSRNGTEATATRFSSAISRRYQTAAEAARPRHAARAPDTPVSPADADGRHPGGSLGEENGAGKESHHPPEAGALRAAATAFPQVAFPGRVPPCPSPPTVTAQPGRQHVVHRRADDRTVGTPGPAPRAYAPAMTRSAFSSGEPGAAV